MRKITDKEVRLALALIKGFEAQKKQSKTVKGVPNTKSGYWKGFEVTKKGFKLECSNGKSYPAVKGVTKDGTKMTLVGIRGQNVWKKPF